MAATIQVAGETATITNGDWVSSHETLLEVLNIMLDPRGPSGADPNPDLHTAQAAIESIGGELVSFDETEFVEGRIY